MIIFCRAGGVQSSVLGTTFDVSSHGVLESTTSLMELIVKSAHIPTHAQQFIADCGFLSWSNRQHIRFVRPCLEMADWGVKHVQNWCLRGLGIRIRRSERTPSGASFSAQIKWLLIDTPWHRLTHRTGVASQCHEAATTMVFIPIMDFSMVEHGLSTHNSRNVLLWFEQHFAAGGELRSLYWLTLSLDIHFV